MDIFFNSDVPNLIDGKLPASGNLASSFTMDSTGLYRWISDSFDEKVTNVLSYYLIL